MRLTVNGAPSEVADGLTVEQLVRQLAADPRGVAVAVDGEVVPKSGWGATELAEGDRVEILTAVQGG
jgi:sulfur carrier protein